MNDKLTLIVVIEINGKSVLAFNADNQVDAERKAQSPMLCSDLMVFETADGPIWNGVDDIVVRESLPAERENWLFVRTHTEPAVGLIRERPRHRDAGDRGRPGARRRETGDHGEGADNDLIFWLRHGCESDNLPLGTFVTLPR
jgi:hypothetical protein